MFPDLTKTLTMAFLGNCLREVFHTLRDFALLGFY